MTDPVGQPAVEDVALAWRPQELRDGIPPEKIVNPIAEPRWTGVRILAHYREQDGSVEWGTVEARDSTGADALDAAARAFDQLRRSIAAADAVIDGIATAQSLRVGVDMDFGLHEGHASGGSDDAAFVALDLLRLDGQLLLDVPLLERKRLLDSLITQSPLVRVSPWRMAPIAPWFRTWRRAGFRSVAIKAANSRYEPGSVSLEWTYTDREPRL